MKSIDEIKNRDELVSELTRVMFEHDKDCIRVDEAIWIEVSDTGIASVVVTRADVWKLGDAEFLCLMRGTYEDSLDQLIEFSDSPISELAYILDMSESDLILKASEFAETDVEDTDIQQITDYIRSDSDLMALIDEAYVEWLEDSRVYEDLVEEYLKELERSLQYR